MTDTSTSKLTKLPVAERLKLIEDLWDSIDAETADLPMPDWHKAELDKRLAAHERDPEAALPWHEVKADIIAKLSK